MEKRRLADYHKSCYHKPGILDTTVICTLIYTLVFCIYPLKTVPLMGLRVGLINAPNLVKVGAAVTSFWSVFHLDMHQLHQLFQVHTKLVQCTKKVQLFWCTLMQN